MVKKDILLRKLKRNQKQLTKLDVLFLTSTMKKGEYKARRKSLELVFRKLEKDAIELKKKIKTN